MVLYISRRAAAGVLLVALVLAGYGCARLAQPIVQSVAAKLSNRLVPIYKVETEKPRLAFSFDATWGTDQTDQLLQLLAEHNVKTTFFLAGNWVESYPEYVRKIAAAGHEIGNHSYAHAHMCQLTAEQMRSDLLKNHELLKSLTGEDADLFRPPFGEYCNTLIEVAESLGYFTVQWSIDSLDWKDLSAAAMVERVRKASPGDIVLFHNAGKHTPEAVARLLTLLASSGYEVVPVGELIYRQNFYVEKHSGLQRPFPAAQPDGGEVTQ